MPILPDHWNPPFIIKIIGVISLVLLIVFVLIWDYYPELLFEKKSEKSEPPKEEKITKDEIADWKTYRNEKYGFDIEYPPNLFLVESPWLTTTGIEFIEDQWIGQKVHYSFIGIEFIETPLTPQEWTEKNEIKNTETLTIGSLSALQFYSAGVSGGGTHTLIQHSKANILIDIESHIGPAGEGKKIPDDIYNEMLSTFRFLE